MSSVSQAIRAYNTALTNLYFHHRETVHHIQSTLRTQILPNVLDELALGDSAHDWAQEWLKDERKFLLGSVVLQKKKYVSSPSFSKNNQKCLYSAPSR